MSHHVYSNADKDKITFTDVLRSFARNGQEIPIDPLRPLMVLPDPENRFRCQLVANGQGGEELSTEQRANAELEAANRIRQSIDNELGPGGGDRVLGRLGLVGAGVLTGAELVKLEQAFHAERNQMNRPLEDLSRPSVQTWKAAGQKTVPSVPMGTGLTVEELLDHPEAQWRIAESGATGALIVSFPDGRGAVVKIEPRQDAMRVEALSSLMEDTMTLGPRPFNVPKARTQGELGNQGVVVGKLMGKLQALQEQNVGNDGMLLKIGKHIENLGRPELLGSVGISTMDFVPGVQLNKLPVDDKMALLQSGVLAREIGKAAVLCPMVGLSDHVALGQSELPTNLSNFMIDRDTGRLAPIDLGARNLNEGTDLPPRYGIRDSAASLKELTEFVRTATSSPEKLRDALHNMVHGRFDGDSKLLTPLTGAMNALTGTQGGEGLINDGPEGRTLGNLLQSQELRLTQSCAMLRGVIEGLKNVHDNQLTLKQAFEEHGHGMKPKEFEELAESLEALDFAKMDQVIGEVEKQLHQEKQSLDKQTVQPELDKLAKLQSRLEKLSQDKPPMGERFKAFFTKGGLEAVKERVSAEIEKTKLDITAKVDSLQLEARVGRNQTELQKLQEAQGQALPGAQAYLGARQQLQQKLSLLAADEVMGPGSLGLSGEAREGLKLQVEQLRQDMSESKGAHEAYTRLEKQIERARGVDSHGKNVQSKSNEVESVLHVQSVRELIGKKVENPDTVKHGTVMKQH